MKRSKFSLSHYKLLTCGMGKLIPVSVLEVLPGDTIQHSTGALVRVTPLVAPVMHPVEVRIHHWFVPYRIIWEDFEDFITGGPDGDDASVPPHFSDLSGVTKGSLSDYLGIPPGITAPINASSLFHRAYQKIWSEHYRDQDLEAPFPDDVGSGAETEADIGVLRNCAWEKDYFTTARPWTQKGPDVSLPLGTQAPVIPAGAPNNQPLFTHPSGPANTPLQVDSARAVSIDTAVSGPGELFWNQSGLVADLTNASAVNINDVRRAFALQRYEEARARYGSRYTEYLAYLGVRSSDARLQRPEYLGGGKQTIQFSEVLQTGPTSPDDTAGVGNLSGHGIGAVRSNRYRRFFEEHGCVISLLSVKPRTMYGQSLHRRFTRSVKEDFFQRELQHIGQQAVLNHEVYGPHATPMGTFGYQDRYDEYRRHESSIAGDFRDTMDHWHYARLFASAPALNADFIKADPTVRVYQEQTADPLWIFANHSIQARRMVSGSAGGHIF